jgi:hypothetical protein
MPPGGVRWLALAHGAVLQLLAGGVRLCHPWAVAAAGLLAACACCATWCMQAQHVSSVFVAMCCSCAAPVIVVW